MDRRIVAAVKIMQQESDSNLAIAQLARRVNLSPWYFTHLFKAETSVSPRHYLRSVKMRKAKKLLVESFLSVKEVVARIGLADPSHFSRDFKKIHGKTPSEFRAQLH